MTTPKGINIVDTLDTLTAVNGTASERTLDKKITHLETHSMNFIERSPFLMLSTSSSEGCDASPRGDAPGFVKCIDSTTLLLPERPGNRIADSLRNIIEQPELGLLFLIPGMDETLRVNGCGYVTDHLPYLEMLEAKGKLPKLAIVVHITELYFHCPKAFIRSGLWNADEHMDRKELPTLGRMVLEQVTGEVPDAALQQALDQSLEQDVAENLY